MRSRCITSSASASASATRSARSPVADWAAIAEVEHDPERRREMLWARERVRRPNPAAVAGIDLTLHGHTVVSEPLQSANALFIETGIYMPGGRLTLQCLDDLC